MSSGQAAAQAVLIVGAGCVGQVFGYHLARGGARVSFLVRPKYREALQPGYTLQRLRLGRAPKALHMQPAPLFDQLEQLEAQRFDLVLLTISSAALDASWLRALLARVGDAVVVSLQPDPADHALIEAALEQRSALVRGNVGFIAFDAPLPGQAWSRARGTAFWFPPLSRSVFSGPAPVVAALVARLRRGGLPARRVRDVSRMLAFPNALGMTYLLALEASGWSIAALRAGPLLDTCERALHEAIAVVRGRLGGAPLGVGVVTRTRWVAWGFTLAAACVPFPLLAFIQRHFTKVAAQTHLIVSRLVTEGERVGIATANLRALLERVGGAPDQLR